MNKLLTEEVKIENMIYEIMLNSKIFADKCHYYYEKIMILINQYDV